MKTIQNADDDLIVISRAGNDLVMQSFVEKLMTALRAHGLTDEEIDSIMCFAIDSTPANPLNPLSPDRATLLAAINAARKAQPPANG